MGCQRLGLPGELGLCSEDQHDERGNAQFTSYQFTSLLELLRSRELSSDSLADFSVHVTFVFHVFATCCPPDISRLVAFHVLGAVAADSTDCVSVVFLR